VSSVPRVLVIHRYGGRGVVSERLRAEGFEAEDYPAIGAKGLRGIRANPPDAILIDLTDLPSYGRYMGAMLREQKGTRMIPLVFLEGDPEKAARVRQMLPDAGFARWPRIGTALRRAIRRAPADPLAPADSKTGLCEKLGIREGSVVALLRAPRGIRKALGPLPGAVRFQNEIGEAGVLLFFTRSAAALGRELPMLAGEMRPRRTLWVCWPKRTSATPCDLTPNLIRDMASLYGLVDRKICSIDETWSGTALSRRGGGRAAGHTEGGRLTGGHREP
jgi:hypothetical protein